MKHIVLPSYSIRAGADLHGKVSIFGYSTPIWVEISDLHTLRVETDLGSVRNELVTQAILEGLIENDLYDATKLLFTPETGIKTRTTTVSNTPLTFVSKGYSIQLPTNDLTQTTELNQPYLSGNIAPNERYASKINKRSETKQLTHPNIVVATPHTVVKVVELETSGKVEITHTEVNGVTLNTLNDVGRAYYYRIHNGSMSVAQKEAEAAFLRSIYPEIESVQIGSQTWATSNLEMVATPMGNVIPEVQDDADWANATNLYDAAIAGGATETEAVKAAAMWCYYNNDPNLGAVYGKLYNWYAAKMLQDDIDAYNVANPTEPWGWRVPLKADFDTLIAALGGASVAGGKMKVTGTDYWNSPNTGATNESGFSAIGSIRINTNGTSQYLKERSGFWASDDLGGGSTSTREIRHNSESIILLPLNYLYGYSIRLIKD